MIRSWRLEDSRQTLVLAGGDHEIAEVIYWGPPLGDRDHDLLQAHAADVTGGMLDRNPAISLCPVEGNGFPGQPGLRLRDLQGRVIYPVFALAEPQQDGNALLLSYRDAGAGLQLDLHLSLDAATHMLMARSVLTSEQPVVLDWLAAPVLPAPQHCGEMIDYGGRWIGEFQQQRTAWSTGARLRDNPTGRTGHEHFPGLILPCHGALNTQGEAYGFHYGWSGGHRLLAEELPDGRRQIQFGHATGSETKAGTRFDSATLFACYSAAGLNGCAVSFQRHLRDRVVQSPVPARPRPVHYNCWEAVYFDHQLDDLKAIADHAATLGAERFVLDDGWFGRRDDDTSSLGDWWVDARKYPDGLEPLIAHVEGLGMGFGLWFEPEMINEDSDLFRAHPEWVLGRADQIRGRQQLVLNMAMPEVREELFTRISALLSKYQIDYIKWDHNRVLPLSDADQTRGTYELLDRLRAKHPHVEIESCSSGGGRIDFGILSRTQRVWLSDSNDALERLRIQHEAAQFLPLTVTGSHVGPRKCHTSGRVLDIRFRAWVAAQRHLGFEMDPRELSAEEAAVLQDVTNWWKANRGWMERADILRLDSADPAVIAEQQLAEDGGRFVVFAGQAASSRQILPRPLRLTGLDPEARYRLELRNRAEAPGLSRAALPIKEGPLELSGQYLMRQGLNLPWHFPETIWVIEGTRL